jgi:hypothetical protein
LGDGRDDNPFRLAFTSYKLLQTIQEYDANNRGVYHLDCTYKIVKYNYPLLVFGFTDLDSRMQSMPDSQIAIELLVFSI